MNLNLAWSAPIPLPSCGYKALYRRKGDPSYTDVSTSGTTATIAIVAPASYEGMIVSNCCSDESSGTPYGVNAYSSLNGSASIDGGILTLVLTSTYGNPYAHIVAGTVLLSGSITKSFSVTYAAGNTTQSYNLGAASGSVVSTTPSSVSPIFNNGGQLQQFDFVNTPPYFDFYWSGDVSGTTWNGAPSGLPSFTLDAFTVTERAPNATVILAGTLDMSYILHSNYPTVYTSITIEVYDPLDVAPIGSVIVTTSPLGLRSTSITLTKGTSALTSGTAFIMKTLLPNLTVLDTKTFYLPS